MRESNFIFTAQNKAFVCITSQWDRRGDFFFNFLLPFFLWFLTFFELALNTTSPLPLFNSLTHFTYLTSTSPRIREIMTTDGGLERLIRILHECCICPPPPENPLQRQLQVNNIGRHRLFTVRISIRVWALGDDQVRVHFFCGLHLLFFW